MKKSPVTTGENPELKKVKNSQPKQRKSRYFSVMTYATEKQIKRIMSNHFSSIRAFCYIHHNKDESEPHYHVIIRTHSTWTANQVCKWFVRLKDKKKEKINTFCEVVNDIQSIMIYLTHSDEESIEKGKHRYQDTEIKDFGIFDLIPPTDSYDSSYQILNEYLVGVPFRELVRRYGRDFLYHSNDYINIGDLIRRDEGFSDAKLRSMRSIYKDKTQLKEIDPEKFSIEELKK